MEDKELEKILQAKADNVKMRDFSEVWEEIKDEIQPPIKEKKFSWKKWWPMMLSSAVLVVCLAFSPLIIKAFNPTPNIPSEEIYYTEELDVQFTTQEEMLSNLTLAKISHIDLSRYNIEGCKLLITEDRVVKGASFTMYDNAGTFYTEMSIYDKNVDLKIDFKFSYNMTCKVNSADVYYKLKQEDGLVYEYDVYAIHNGVQYVMAYSGFSNNLMDFLNEFFG